METIAEFQVVFKREAGGRYAPYAKFYKIYSENEGEKRIWRNILIADVSHLLKDLISDKDNEDLISTKDEEN